MSGNQITFLDQFRQSEGLLERARRRRNEALGRRRAGIIQTSKEGEGVVEQVFGGVPRRIDQTDLTETDAGTGVRMEPVMGQKDCDGAKGAS